MQPQIHPSLSLAAPLRAPDSDLRHTRRQRIKLELMAHIARLVRERGVNQTEAGAILGIRQPQVSQLLRGQPGAFSVSRLIEFLTLLGQDVEIALRPAGHTQGEVSIRFG